MTDITLLLSQMEAGDPLAVERLLPLVYSELRQLAAARLAHEKPGHTLQPTALVHEAYLRLVGQAGLGFNSRAHFFFAAAEAMRRILVEAARRKATTKRGGECQRVELNDSLEATLAAIERPDEAIAVHEALDALAAEDELAAQLVKLHYFGGFSKEDAGKLLGMSRPATYRTWTYARAWLRAMLTR